MLDKAYNPTDHEQEIYKLWENSGAFSPKIDPKKKPFVISMPPPNITGKLHIGHALFITLQDILTRYHRMKGEPTLWLPGTDHAGIATQSVVEKALAKEGIRRRDIGREKFVERVWQWKQQYGGEITKQLRSVGASCDWSRERFTLDEGLSQAVNEAFVRLHDKGLIYRDNYIVNWCPKCGTAIADDEVEHKEQTGVLYTFKYDHNFPIAISTTRPETKLGDVAVAVNPKDKRYQEFVGREFDIELDGVKRKIKIIADRSVDKDFGTGAVGITPAHSMTDWRIAEDHDLPKIQVINEYGKMTAEAGRYEDLKVIEAREKLVEYLESNKLLVKSQGYVNNLSVCYRCDGAIEPLPSLQWFVKMKPLAEQAKKAVESGEIEIVPKRFEKVYFHWMDNIRDWCISRQLWWGHRIPVYYRRQESNTNNQETNSKLTPNSKPQITNRDEIYVGVTPPEGEGWVQDEDVLDTWFSSGLWPFSTLGWPDENAEDYKYFYPTTVMETGYDILFFWVARMIMMGLELTGKPPFKTVYLHGLVRDEHNRKFSKSLGNGIDPIDMSDKFGTDALRMSLVVGATAGNDIGIGESKIKGYRNFSNKIWNIARFVLTNLEDSKLQEINSKQISNYKFMGQDKKDLEGLGEVIEKTTRYLDNFQFSRAGELLYDYTWHEFADKIIEGAKPRLQSENEQDAKAALFKLLTILESILKLLHPLVPFVTETIWQKFPENLKDSQLLITGNWPHKVNK